jgi:4-hydroxybenzoate polyprenyltransferase
MRPKQWTKNGFIFIGFIFTLNQYWAPFTPKMYQMLATAIAAFVIFCMLSSSVYLINDIADLENDRLHPIKRHRPLAAGRLKPIYAASVAILLCAIALPAAFYLDRAFGLVALIYFAIMLAYSSILKTLVIVDALTIAIGYVLRAVAGAVAINVDISPWLVVCVLLGSLFIAFAKRRHELILLNNEATNHRPILSEYSPALLDEIINVVVSTAIIAYSLYTFTYEKLPKNHAMMLTIPFILYGAFRYLYLMHLKNEGGSPEETLLKDIPLLLDIGLWLLAVIAILYLFRAQTV